MGLDAVRTLFTHHVNSVLDWTDKAIMESKFPLLAGSAEIFVRLHMSIVHFSVFHSRKTRDKETYDLSDTAYSGCFLKQQVLRSGSDLHGFGSCESYCHSDTVQYKAQKIYLFAGAGVQTSQGGQYQLYFYDIN